MKTIKLTENGVEVKYALTPIGKNLEIPTGISQCANCDQVYRSFENHECKPKFEVWRPKVGELICNIDYDGSASRCLFIEGEAPYKAFQTKEQAIEAHEKALFNYEVEMFIKEKNEGWVPDWNNDEKKYRIACFVTLIGIERLDVYSNQNEKHTSDSKHFKIKEIGEEILAKFEHDKLLKWWI